MLRLEYHRHGLILSYYAEHNAAVHQCMRSAAQPAEVLLDQPPVAVLVRLHVCKPSLPQLMSIGLSDKIREIIEGGPPDNLVQTFNTLFQDKAEQTLAAALEARRRLGW